MKILEEFLRGNIDLTDYDATACKEYEETLHVISKNEEKLQSIMTDEQKELLAQYTDAICEYQTMAESLLFPTQLPIWRKNDVGSHGITESRYGEN